MEVMEPDRKLAQSYQMLQKSVDQLLSNFIMLRTREFQIGTLEKQVEGMAARSHRFLAETATLNKVIRGGSGVGSNLLTPAWVRPGTMKGMSVAMIFAMTSFYTLETWYPNRYPNITSNLGVLGGAVLMYSAHTELALGFEARRQLRVALNDLEECINLAPQDSVGIDMKRAKEIFTPDGEATSWAEVPNSLFCWLLRRVKGNLALSI